MKTSDFDYDLPKELIAHFPTPSRGASRLLCLDRKTGALEHRHFEDLLALLNPNDLLVMNNSKVIPARLFGTKETGGKVEILVERLLGTHEALVHMKASKPARTGMRVMLEACHSRESGNPDGLKYHENTRVALKEKSWIAGMTEVGSCAVQIEILGRENDLFKIKFLSDEPALTLLERYGHMPLPPYIERADNECDIERYQTVYAQPPGSVAAPTAGLHFDEALLQKIKDKGVSVDFVTLHVGAGTFQPVRVDNLHDHKMHSEWISVPKSVCEQVRDTQKRGGRVIAVGTTSVRCLETASRSGNIQPFEGETDIFIFPGYEFKCVDAMITNFHLPQSTLLMLVAAFAGYTTVMDAYRVAIAERYRFYSYGDAMFIR